MYFKIYTENKYMWALSLAIASIGISIAIGDGTETRSSGYLRSALLACRAVARPNIELEICIKHKYRTNYTHNYLI